MSSSPLGRLELILELLQEDIIPRLYALEKKVHTHVADVRSEFMDVHGELHWLDQNLRIEYPGWYQLSDDDDEE